MAKDAARIATKWARNLGGATESIKAGVEAVTRSPTEAAAERADAYAQGVLKSVADGRFQAGLRRVTLADWKRAMIEKGVNRVSSGALAAQPKMQAFLVKFLPHVEAGQRMLESMPRGDLQQNIARAIKMMEHNATFRNNS